jgi:hypothetical protein
MTRAKAIEVLKRGTITREAIIAYRRIFCSEYVNYSDEARDEESRLDDMTHVTAIGFADDDKKHDDPGYFDTIQRAKENYRRNYYA